MSAERSTAMAVVASLALHASTGIAQGAPQSPAPPYLTGTCTNCHGTDGRSSGAMPSLAGLPAPYVAEQMRLFREGKRPATIMHQLAKGYTDEQIVMLAEYFARQKPAP